MGKIYTSGSPISKVYNVSLNAPFDTRLTVQNIADLTDGENGGVAALVYRGMVVYVHQDKSLYIYTGASNGTWKNKSNGKLINGGDINNWKKLIVNPADALEFYEGVFAKKEELAGFLTNSDLDNYVKVEDIADVTSGFVTESDLNLYVKTEDIADFVKSADIKDFAKNEDLVDFLTASDVDEFVRLDELHKIISEEVADKFVSQSDLDVYVKTEDILDFVTSSELDARIAAINIPEVPTNVSAFTNDAGYLTKNDLPDFLTASDVEDFVSVEELKNYVTKADITNFVSQSDLDVYVKTEDVVKKLENYATKADITNFLTANDVKDFVKVGDIADVVRTDELKQYVKTSDVVDFLTASDITDVVRTKDIADFIKESELPDFLLASDLDGYVKTEDLKGYIPMTELERLASKSDLNGYVKTSDAIAYLTASDLEGFATLDKIPTAGSFPAASNIDSSVAPVNGYATVQGVMDYVNALLEKKKDELVKSDYLYTNGYRRGEASINLTDPLNEYKIVLDSNNEFVIELLHKNEEDGYYDIDDPSGNYYGKYFKVILPNNYDVKVYLWDVDNNDYNKTEASKADPAYSLIAKDVTPDNTTYYYKDAVDGFLFSGSKNTIEATISQTYNNHLLKLVITKKII